MASILALHQAVASSMDPRTMLASIRCRVVICVPTLLSISTLVAIILATWVHLQSSADVHVVAAFAVPLSQTVVPVEVNGATFPSQGFCLASHPERVPTPLLWTSQPAEELNQPHKLQCTWTSFDYLQDAPQAVSGLQLCRCTAQSRCSASLR